MKQRGFTLIEVLVVVVIIGVLVSMALPMYTRTIERSRAAEAMTIVKTINDAVYVYYSDKEKCPTSFSQLVVSLPITQKITKRKVNTKFFEFILTGKNVPLIPGTTCEGTLAKRINGGDYKYGIYNPYRTIAGEASSLACTPVDTTTDTQKKKSQEICESLGMYISLSDLLGE